jgi:hypothetical protein
MSDFRKSIRKVLNNNPAPSLLRNQQSLILSSLNLLQVMEESAPKYLRNWLHYGPAAFVGEGWASYLVWYREKGYNNYQELFLFGVWARQEDESIAMLIGTKPLKFSAPVFNAESYNAIIKTTFKPYYNDKGNPPAEEDVHYRAVYDESRRLALRRELADAIVQALREKSK